MTDNRPSNRVVALCYYPAEDNSRWPETSLLTERREEAEGLLISAGLEIVITLSGKLRTPLAATLISKGIVNEAAEALEANSAGLLYVDFDLSPVQQRNLERQLNVKVIDRTGLILAIFAERATTLEGELQVTLAQYHYQRSRLVRSWTHLERQRGGRGFLGGPGETQIEADRRAIDERIRQLTKRLEQVRQRRQSQRDRRRRSDLPSIALVGYTNAGKTTIFERLTAQKAEGEDRLFATLDPLVRHVRLGKLDVLISDTVGFIKNLPTSLIAAFLATLEEVTEADLILHLRDASNPHHEEQAEAVYRVLDELGLDEEALSGKLIEVWNKIDRLDEEEIAKRLPEGSHQADQVPGCAVSALTGQGLEALSDAIETLLKGRRKSLDLVLGIEEGATLAFLHRHAHILTRRVDDFGAHHLTISATQDVLHELDRRRGEKVVNPS